MGFMDPGFPDTPSFDVLIEMLLWLYLLGRLVEELEQALLEKRTLDYFGDFWECSESADQIQRLVPPTKNSMGPSCQLL